MPPSPLPPALWLLPASLLAAVIAGACLGGHEAASASQVAQRAAVRPAQH